MNTSRQKRTELNEKSGSKVAQQRFGRTDARYWNDAIFKRPYVRDGQTLHVEHWTARIQWRGRREFFNLHTLNKAAAAAKARDIYAMLAGAGWDATLAKFKPDMERRSVTTVGEFLTELGSHWTGKPKTFADYARSFRTIVSQVFGIKGGRAKFDYVNGGRAAWAAKIDEIRLGDLTPEKVNKWRVAFVKRAGDNPLKQRRARITCTSLMRQAKSLFAPDLLAHVPINKPDASPFDGVEFYARESMRYKSTIDIEALIEAAIAELPQEQMKIFLLATMAGLRRNEIDKLPWTAFRWQERLIRIETTEHFQPKTSDSSDDIPVDPELLAMFRGWHATATGDFVIESDGAPVAGAKFTHYRAAEHFNALTKWLRNKGVAAPKPLHELRKEFGSQLCKKHGIYAASRMLRHADISITAEHYLDAKKRVTFGFGKLLPKPSNITPIPNSKAAPGKEPVAVRAS